MVCLHAREEVERSLLRLDAVRADVPSQFHGKCELRFEDRDLVRKRYCEWRELPPTVVHVGGVRGVRGRGVRDTADAVEPYFAKHRMGERLEGGAEGGEDDGEGCGLRQGGKETGEGGFVVGFGLGVWEEEGAVVYLFGW